MEPTIITSTPIQQSNISGNLKSDLQPDLLPNKMTPQSFMKISTPDLLNQGPGEIQHQRNSYQVSKKEAEDFSPIVKANEYCQRSIFNSNDMKKHQRKEGRVLFPTDKDRYFPRKLSLSLPQTDSSSPLPSDEDKEISNYGYISDRAKREFFSSGSRSGTASPVSRRQSTSSNIPSK